MYELANRGLDVVTGLGAVYGDIRIIESKSEIIYVKNGQVAVLHGGTSYGFGIRVIVDGSWGFAASPVVEPEEVTRVAEEAVRVARASARLRNRFVTLPPGRRESAVWCSPVEENPFAVSMDEKIGLLLQCDKLMAAVKGVTLTSAHLHIETEKKVYADSEGARIQQEITHTGTGIEATAVTADEMQRRSYPTSFGGQYGSAGYELVRAMALPEHAPRIAGEAVALLAARPCPSGVKDIILSSDQLALQIHESCGHPAELDRVMGSEISDYGTSFLTPEKLNTFRYGSELVTLYADPRIPGGLGSYAYDDEGVPARRTDLVRNGLFCGYLVSRETAPLVNQEPNGSMRADGWNNMPLIRITNINLEPGDASLDQLISETEDGLYMLTNKSWSIDEQRLNFQFGTEIAYEIKGGKLGDMVKNPTYGGSTPSFWNSCDGIAGPDEWLLWGVPNCGKGEPDQGARVGHGAAPARFRNVKVGVV
ncbi:TldD/PmbA family protein [bacterium]|nr:TldD/PmbA family protein [candidate division CSSED10-310 bacterium]